MDRTGVAVVPYDSVSEGPPPTDPPETTEESFPLAEPPAAVYNATFIMRKATLECWVKQ